MHGYTNTFVSQEYNALNQSYTQGFIALVLSTDNQPTNQKSVYIDSVTVVQYLSLLESFVWK